MLVCFVVHHVRPGSAEAMTVLRRRLFGLWLLMGALQGVLGQPGLGQPGLEPERPVLRAVIWVTLLKQEPSGEPFALDGVFVGGSAGSAEGKLMQVRTHVVRWTGTPDPAPHSAHSHRGEGVYGLMAQRHMGRCV